MTHLTDLITLDFAEKFNHLDDVGWYEFATFSNKLVTRFLS